MNLYWAASAPSGEIHTGDYITAIDDVTAIANSNMPPKAAGE